MVSKKKITSTMKSALINASKKHNVPLAKLRLKINIKNDEAICIALNSTETIEVVEWGDVCGVGSLDVFGVAKIVKEKIKAKLISLAEIHSFTMDSINVRIYSEDSEGTPSLFIYDKGKPFKKMNIEEII
tara:strand:+ start:1439 stop:1828 length:390 start_codon:yes stop_codon:yes gene_type:complete